MRDLRVIDEAVRFGVAAVAGLATELHPTAGTVAYRRDGAGRLLDAQGPGWRRSWSYADGHVVSTSFARDGAPPRTTTLQRDGAGRVVAVEEAGATTSYAYDPAGQLAAEDGPSGPRRFTYDAAGRLAAEAGPHGATTYAYDPAHQLVSTHGASGDWNYTYDGAGRAPPSTAPPAPGVSTGAPRPLARHRAPGRRRQRHPHRADRGCRR